MFFGFGGSSSNAGGAADKNDKNAKLLASAFHESLENLILESTKHRGMNTVRDMAHAARSKYYAPNDLLHTFIVACELSDHRKSCRLILLQCLGDISKLFSLNLLPVTVQVAQAVCDMARKLAITLPERQQQYQQGRSGLSAAPSPLPSSLTTPTPATHRQQCSGAEREVSVDAAAAAAGGTASTYPTSAARTVGRGWALVPDEELLLRILQLLVSVLSACPLGNPALAELLGILFVFYAGAAPNSTLEEVCGTTLVQRTHMYCSELLHGSLDTDRPPGGGRDGLHSSKTDITAATTPASGGRPASASGSFNAQLHAVAYFKDLCAMAGGRQPRWLRLTIAAVRPRGGGIPIAPANSPGGAANVGTGRSTTTTTGNSGGYQQQQQQQQQQQRHHPLASPPALSLSASGSIPLKQQAYDHLGSPPAVTTTTMTDSSVFSDDMTEMELESGNVAAGTMVEVPHCPHRLRVFVLRTLTQFFMDQSPCVPDAGSGSGGGGGDAAGQAGGRGGTPAAAANLPPPAVSTSPVNPLFAQCLNEDVIGLAVSTTHPAFGNGMDDDDDSSRGVARRRGVPLGDMDERERNQGYGESGASAQRVVECEEASQATAPQTSQQHLSASAVAPPPPVGFTTTDSSSSSKTGRGDAAIPSAHHQQQQQQQKRLRQQTARAQEAGEAEQRFVLGQKLALLVLQKYAPVLRNTANSLVLSHALMLQQCRSLPSFARMFCRVPGTVASPLAVMAVLLALWKKTITNDALLRLLLTTYTSAYPSTAVVAGEPGRPGGRNTGSQLTLSPPPSSTTTRAGAASDGGRGEANEEEVGRAEVGELPAFVSLVTECATLVFEVASRILNGTAAATSGGGKGGTADDAATATAAAAAAAAADADNSDKEEWQEVFPGNAAADAKEYLGDALAFLTMFSQSFARLVEHACSGGGDPKNASDGYAAATASHPGSTATLLSLMEPPMTVAVGATPTVMSVSDVRKLFLSLSTCLRRGIGLALQGVLDEDSLHLALKGVTHWISTAALLNLPAERNGFLRDLLTALRRHDPTADAIIAYAVQHHPSAARTDRQRSQSPKRRSHGQGVSTHATAAATAQPAQGGDGERTGGGITNAGRGTTRSSSSHGGGGGGGHSHSDPAGTSTSTAVATAAGTETFGKWVVRNMRRFAQDAGGALAAANAGGWSGEETSGNSTAAAGRARTGGFFSDVYYAKGMRTQKSGRKRWAVGMGTGVDGGGAGASGGNGSGGASLFTSGQEEQAHIMLAVERLQQKLFVLRSLFTVASGMGEALGPDGWAILAEGFSAVEPCIYRLQLYVLWIAEAAVEREQQRQLLSDAYHLRDAMRSLYVECAMTFSDTAFSTFLSSMMTATVERSATTQARLAARYADTLDGDDDDASSSGASDIEDDAAAGGTRGDMREPATVLTSGASAYGYGCFWHWRLVSEGLCLAFTALLPLQPARAALVWQSLTQLYGYVLHPQRLEQWCTFLKAFPLRVSMLAFYDDASARGAAAAASGGGGGGGAGSGAASNMMMATTATMAAALGGAGGSGAAGGSPLLSGGGTSSTSGGAVVSATDGTLLPIEMRELHSVLGSLIENVTVVCAFASLYTGRAVSMDYEVQQQQQQQQQSPTPVNDIPRLVEAMVGRLVSTGSATAGSSPSSSHSAVGAFSSTRLACIAVQVLAPPVFESAPSRSSAVASSVGNSASNSGSSGYTPSVFNRLVADIMATATAGTLPTPTVVTPRVVARRLVDIIAASAPLPFQLLDDLYAGFRTAMTVVIVRSGRRRGDSAAPPTTHTDTPTTSLLPPPVAGMLTLGQEAFTQQCNEAAFAILKEVQRLVQSCGEDIRGRAWTHLLRLLQRTVTGSRSGNEHHMGEAYPYHQPQQPLAPATDSSSSRTAAGDEGTALSLSPPPSSSMPPPTTTTTAPDYAVQLAFRTLEMVQHNCITSLDAEAFGQLTRSAGAFIGYANENAYEEKRLHTNLSAVQMLWSIADYLATLDVASLAAAAPTSLTGVADSVGGSQQERQRAGGEVRDALWCTLLMQLQEHGCLDGRQEVRQSAQKTLYALVQTHGGQYGWSCWRCFLLSILAPQMHVVLGAQRDRQVAVIGDVTAKPTAQGSPLRGNSSSSSSSAPPSLFLSDESVKEGGGGGASLHARKAMTGLGGGGRGEPLVSFYSGMAPASPKAHALRQDFNTNLSALEEMRITVTDGASRIFVSHYLRMRQGGSASASGSNRGGEAHTGFAVATEAAARLAESALRAFIRFAGDVCVILARGEAGVRGGARIGLREESSLSAIHALHSLMVEIPDTSAATAVTHPMRHLCWQSLEHLLYFDPSQVVANAAATQGQQSTEKGDSTNGAAATRATATTATSAGDGGDHRTAAVVSALIAALCDDFRTKRTYYGSGSHNNDSDIASQDEVGGTGERDAARTSGPPAVRSSNSSTTTPPPASSPRVSSFFARFVAFSYAEGGEFNDDDDDDNGAAAATPFTTPSPPSSRRPPQDPFFGRLLGAMAFAATSDAVVSSYFFPGKVQNTLTEAVAAVWPVLRGSPHPHNNSNSNNNNLPALASVAPTGLAWRATFAERVRLMEVLLWPQFPPRERVVYFVTRSNARDGDMAAATGSGGGGGGSTMEDRPTLRSTMPPGSHPSALLQTLSLIAALALGIQPGHGTESGVSTASGGACDAVDVLFMGATAAHLLHEMGTLLMLQYASEEAQAGSVPGAMPFGIPAHFFEQCLRLLHAVMWQVILPSPPPPPAAAQDAHEENQKGSNRNNSNNNREEDGDGARRVCRREGVAAFSAVVRELVAVASATVKTFEDAERQRRGSRGEEVTTKQKGSRATQPPSPLARNSSNDNGSYGPAVLPDALHAALSVLDALVMDCDTLIQRLILEYDDATSAAEVIAALVAAASMESVSLANVSQRSLKILKEWSEEKVGNAGSSNGGNAAADEQSTQARAEDEDGDSASRRSSRAAAAASAAAARAAGTRNTKREENGDSRQALHTIVRASMHTRCQSIMAQYHDDPANVNVTVLLRDALDTLAQSCPPPPATATVRDHSDPYAEEREALRRLLPGLTRLIAVPGGGGGAEASAPSPEQSLEEASHRAVLEVNLRQQLANTLMAIYNSLGLL